MQIYIARDITSCTPLEVNRRSGEKYHFHLHDWIVSEGRNQHGTGSLVLPASCNKLTLISVNIYMMSHFSRWYISKSSTWESQICHRSNCYIYNIYFSEILGFRTLSIVLVLKNKLRKNTTFRKLDLFPSSGNQQNRVFPHLRRETDTVSETFFP
jgi:hypothetical protein